MIYRNNKIQKTYKFQEKKTWNKKQNKKLNKKHKHLYYNIHYKNSKKINNNTLKKLVVVQ